MFPYITIWIISILLSTVQLSDVVDYLDMVHFDTHLQFICTLKSRHLSAICAISHLTAWSKYALQSVKNPYTKLLMFIHRKKTFVTPDSSRDSVSIRNTHVSEAPVGLYDLEHV